ncbi:MAG: hypothetical protein KME32_23425 [Mojavia pulchra JT2-VF2]|jgi:hypothetical protein|uniref:TrbI/VirB10 family protein n=1 Tax=Mojavia pulchra JT2-VF2 TaxID=287848 RepID=A0A951Q3H5_9NOST|nr:hypothetical protein [Mojavia pulchra JT2-VF2]
MTKTSVTSETPTQDLITPTSNEYLLEVGTTDWELRMARLVGLEDESLSTNVELVEESATLQPSLVQPPEAKTEQPLSSNPFAKLGVVGTVTLVIVLFAGGFLSQLMSGTNQKPKNKNIVPPVIQSQPTNQSDLQKLEGEIETLKTKLALAEQAQAVKLAQQSLRSTITSLPQLEASANSRKKLTVAQQKPTPLPTIYQPRIVTVERLVRSPYPQQNLLPQPSLLPLPQPIVTNPENPSPKPNPFQDWKRLATLGSYGQVSATAKPNVNATTLESPTNNQTQQQVINPKPEQTQQQQSSKVSQVGQQGQKSIAVGSHAKAVLATAVFGETNQPTNTERKNLFVVRLKEPLKAVDGAIAIPANTELLTEIRSLTEQGLLQLDVNTLILQDNGNLTEKSLPQNAMMIRAPQGKPLIAKQFPNHGSSIMGMDMGLFVLGGLGKAAELFNRTEAQVVTTSSTGTIVSNTNPRRNVVAGVFEGGMNTVVPQIAQRNQQAISQMTQRTNIWFLPAGTEVEIYINQVMQF